MECNFDKSLLQSFIDNTIEPLEIIILTEHLKNCKQCLNELEELYLLDKELKSMFQEEMVYGNNFQGVTELTVENIFMQECRDKKLKRVINETIRMNGIILENSSRFLKYIPKIPSFGIRTRDKYKFVRNILPILVRGKS